MVIKKKTKRKYKKVSSHDSKEAALRKAARLRAEGHRCRVRKDLLTGKWIVEILTFVLVVGLLGALLRPR